MPAAPPRSRAETSPRGRPVILLVDDDRPVRAVARRVLVAAGYHTLEATHGAEALEIWQARAEAITGLLIDVRMPGLDGFEVAARVRADEPSIPVVLMTGYAEETARATAPQPRLPMLEKPFTADELLATIDHAVRGAAAGAAAPDGARGDAARVAIGALTYTYVVDAADRITAIDAAWADFAAENGAPALPDTVVGTSIWRYLADPTTRHLYQLLCARVRDRSRAVQVPFRCDAPSEVREMELSIAPLPARGLRMEVRLLRRRTRAFVPFLDPAIPRSDAFVRLCSWCTRVNLAGQWHELEDAMQASGVLRESPMPEVSHGMCADCETRVHALLD